MPQHKSTQSLSDGPGALGGSNVPRLHRQASLSLSLPGKDGSASGHGRSMSILRQGSFVMGGGDGGAGGVDYYAAVAAGADLQGALQ